MITQFIDKSALVKNSQIGTVKLYKNVVISDSILGNNCSVGDDTTIERCHFENNVVVNRRSYINDTSIDMFSYTGINSTINWAKIGRFCSFGRNVDIGGFDHDYRKLTTMPEFRLLQINNGGGKIPTPHPIDEYCLIGNDVWIAAGAQILHNVSIGDGAVVGGGAVVTHDVPPYAVVAGVPAKIISFRCSEKQIEKLMKIKWWNWPKELILQHIDYLMINDISDKTIEYLENIKNDFN